MVLLFDSWQASGPPPEGWGRPAERAGDPPSTPFLLANESWNDFGHSTIFEMSVMSQQRWVHAGWLSIAFPGAFQSKSTFSRLGRPSSLERLPRGATSFVPVETYERMVELVGFSATGSILDSLNDASTVSKAALEEVAASEVYELSISRGGPDPLKAAEEVRAKRKEFAAGTGRVALDGVVTTPPRSLGSQPAGDTGGKVAVVATVVSAFAAIFAILFGQGLISSPAEDTSAGSDTIEAPQEGFEPTGPVQAGYSIGRCGLIADANTGLEWFLGEDRDYTWVEARDFVSGLDECGGGWRMPVSSELIALHEPGESAGIGHFESGDRFPAKINAIFEGIGSGSWVWTSVELSSGSAVSVNMFLIDSDDPSQSEITMEKENPGFPIRVFAVRETRDQR